MKNNKLLSSVILFSFGALMAGCASTENAVYAHGGYTYFEVKKLDSKNFELEGRAASAVSLANLEILYAQRAKQLCENGEFEQISQNKVYYYPAGIVSLRAYKRIGKIMCK